MHSESQAGLVRYPLGGDTILFVERSRRLVLLNPTAELVLNGLESGLSPDEIVRIISASLRAADGSRLEATNIEADVRALIRNLQEADCFGSDPRSAGDVDEVRQWAHPAQPDSPLDQPSPGRPAFQGHYRLAGLRFLLETNSTVVARLAGDLFGHLEDDTCRAGNGTESGATFTVQEAPTGWVLFLDGSIADHCQSMDGVAPMLHGHILLKAYEASHALAALHAAAVGRNGGCVLLPGVSGTGKTTLTAALLARGFEYYTDDLALLTHAPVRLEPVLTCLGLKKGAWDLLADMLPDLGAQSAHRRKDGQWVKYLSPRGTPALSRNGDKVRVHAVVFPVRKPGSPVRLERIGPAEALLRLTAAGYDLPNRIDRQTVESLIRWMANLQCFELQFDGLDEAVDRIGTVLP